MLETPARIEPCSFDEDIPHILADLAGEIQRESALLGRDLHPDAAAELADFVRVMNCYYSNLIEGHDTRPRDIERALADVELDEERRPLALEARAHVLVQRMIDESFTASSLPSPIGFVTWVHRQFYENMPPEFRTARGKDGRLLPIEPGSFRSKSEEDVAVGRHVPPSSDRVADFMGYFEQRFRAEHAGASTRILAIAVAHHRLNYIHPFLDGNGRVSRLMSHAMGLKAGIGGEGLGYVDFDQFEVGIMAALSGDEELKRLYSAGDMYDLFATTHLGLVGNRKAAKQLFLSYAYGMSRKALVDAAVSLGVDRQKAKEAFRLFQRYEDWKRGVWAEFESTGRVATVLGNHYRRAGRGQLTGKEQRSAVSQVVQGTASLIFKRALFASSTIEDVKIVLPMHDALLFEHRLADTPAKVIESFERGMTEILDEQVAGKASISDFAARELASTASGDYQV
jgi:hypothetical protein